MYNHLPSTLFCSDRAGRGPLVAQPCTLRTKTSRMRRSTTTPTMRSCSCLSIALSCIVSLPLTSILSVTSTSTTQLYCHRMASAVVASPLQSPHESVIVDSSSHSAVADLHTARHPPTDQPRLTPPMECNRIPLGWPSYDYILDYSSNTSLPLHPARRIPRTWMVSLICPP